MSGAGAPALSNELLDALGRHVNNSHRAHLDGL
jgi:hypothetical protein